MVPRNFHSPGNVVVNTQRGGSRVVFMGDVSHHRIQLVRPDIPFFADQNPAEACAARYFSYDFL